MARQNQGYLIYSRISGNYGQNADRNIGNNSVRIGDSAYRTITLQWGALLFQILDQLLFSSSSSYYYFIPSVPKIPRDFAQKLSKCKVLEFTHPGGRQKKCCAARKN